MELRTSDVDEIFKNSVAEGYFSFEMEPTLEPYVGMQFNSEVAARIFYIGYAAQMGFKARVSSFIRSKRDKTIISRQFVCSREGFRSNKDSENGGRVKRPRMITRTGCRAMIMVKKQSSEKWVISKCEKIHNHVLGIQGKVVMLDYDPYEREDEELSENPLAQYYGDVKLDDPDSMTVIPPEGDPDLEPCLGMEFDSENDAHNFYKLYARHVGFRARVSSYYRSKRDNSIISRLFVCSKEGHRGKKDTCSEERFQRPRAITRVGCKAMVMVKKRNTGKWVISKLVKAHNHVLVPSNGSEDQHSEERDDDINQVEKTVASFNGQTTLEPFEGMEFDSEEAAKLFYFAYSRLVGFNMRVSTYYRSKHDKSIISRLFVCCKEGFNVKKERGSEGKIKRPREGTRIGCKAMLMVKKNISGRWFVSKFEKDHNHPLGSLRKIRQLGKRKSFGNKEKASTSNVHSSCSSQKSPILYNKLCQETMEYPEVGAATPDVYCAAIRDLHEAVKKVTSVRKDIRATMPNNEDVLNDSDLTGRSSVVNSKFTCQCVGVRNGSNGQSRTSHEKSSRTSIYKMHKLPADGSCSLLNQDARTVYHVS